MKYAIADYFSLEARVSAASQSYEYRSRGPRNPDGYCPIGLMLEADHIARGQQCPTASHARHIIAAKAPDNCPSIQALAAFIAKWDTGQITDLREVLGVAS